MSGVDKDYELNIFRMIVDKYLDEYISVTEESLNILETNIDYQVWYLATKVYSQSGHRVEFSTVRDVVNSRISILKDRLAVQKELVAAQTRHLAEQKAQEEALEAHRIARQKAQEAAEEAHRIAEYEAQEEALEARLSTAFEEVMGDEDKCKILSKMWMIIREELSVDSVSEPILDCHISRDLGADECDTRQLAMTLEEAFDIEIPDDILGSMKRYTPSHYSDSWSPSDYSNSLGDYDPVACTVRELLLFIHEKVSSLA